MITLAIHTANHWPDSVCHISLAKIQQGQIIDTLDTYIYAEEFDPFFTSLHGIRAEDVKQAPTFKAFEPILTQWLTNETVVAYYAPYEEQVLRDVYAAQGKLVPNVNFLSLLQRAKTEWPHITPSLPHIALQVAPTLAPTEGEMLAAILCAMQWTETDLLLTAPSAVSSVQSLVGETIVFTGGLEGMTRSTAARLIRQQGAMFSNTITMHTTLLVISASSLERHECTGQESTKWRRAKQLIAQGQTLRIITEQQFKDFL